MAQLLRRLMFEKLARTSLENPTLPTLPRGNAGFKQFCYNSAGCRTALVCKSVSPPPSLPSCWT